MKTFYLETFGCQMNVHDSEKVAGLLAARGYTQVDCPEQADLILYNTCSIREKAEQKVYSRLQQFRRHSDGKLVAVLGCVAQQEGERIFERAPQVALVCGSACYWRLPELLERLEGGERRLAALEQNTDETFEPRLARRQSPYRAYLTIIEGCDKQCTFCVVPFTRGRERSRSSQNILREARALVAAGYTEIQLLGQNVSSYRDPSPAGWDFPTLLAEVAAIPGLKRLRFTTSHPKDFDRRIVTCIEENPVLANHVHLPVQSGSDRVLQRMRRQYTREQYLEKVAWIKGARRAIAISTDIIVGFPGETEEDFQQTLSLLDEVGYDAVFSFKYSARPHTAALKLDGHLPEQEKGRRLAILQERQRAIQLRRNGEWIGRTVEVLVESFNSATGQWVGRTSENRVVNFHAPGEQSSSLAGRYVQVHISRAGPNSLAGELAGL